MKKISFYFNVGILIAVFLCHSLVSVGLAQTNVAPPLPKEEEIVLDEKTVEVCNQVILNIYQAILSVKDQYTELEQFDDSVFYKNKKGLYTIIYDYKGEGTKGKPSSPFSFGITVDGMDDKTFTNKQNMFNYGFPVLKLKISGYQVKHRVRRQYDIMSVVEREAVLLGDHQQEYMPLRLFLKPIKKVYKVKEDIEFEVIIQNVSKRNMTVRPINARTLYLLLDNDFWGTNPKQRRGKRGKRQILRSGEMLRKVYKGESFNRPREVDIVGVYNMKIYGVTPMGRLTIQIVADDEAEQKIK